MNEDYLWDRSGATDPEVERLEKTLAPLAYRGALTAPPAGRRRLRLGPALAAAAALAVIWTGTWLLGRGGAPATKTVAAGPALAVEALAGTTTIERADLDGAGRLGVGEWLETGADGRARLTVADIGEVTVHGGSRLALLATEAAEHRLRLERGRLEAFITAPPRLFFVDTPSAVAVDLGCFYELAVAEDGSAAIEVTLGWVALETPARSARVPAGARCETRVGAGPGTPHFADAPPALRSALRELDFADAGKTDGALAVVLAEARERDTLTLWHLVPRVAGPARDDVVARLAALAPPPPEITAEGLRRADPAMLERWWSALEPTW